MTLLQGSPFPALSELWAIFILLQEQANGISLWVILAFSEGFQKKEFLKKALSQIKTPRILITHFYFTKKFTKILITVDEFSKRQNDDSCDAL